MGGDEAGKKDEGGGHTVGFRDGMQVTELGKPQEPGAVGSFGGRGVGRKDGFEGEGRDFVRKGVTDLVFESQGVWGRPAAEPVRCGDVGAI